MTTRDCLLIKAKITERAQRIGASAWFALYSPAKPAGKRRRSNVDLAVWRLA